MVVEFDTLEDLGLGKHIPLGYGENGHGERVSAAGTAPLLHGSTHSSVYTSCPKAAAALFHPFTIPTALKVIGS